MLIHDTSDPSGRASALAIHPPAACLMPNEEPEEIIKLQSAVIWFHPASTDSGQTASASCGLSWRIGSPPASAASEATIAHLVVRRLAEAGAAAREPVGSPADHALQRDARTTKLGHHPRRVADPAHFR